MKHKCDFCKFKGEHQEMGFKISWVCTKEHDLMKAMRAYMATECPFAKKVELEPCPFCGKQPRIFEGIVLLEGASVYQVFCNNPDCPNYKNHAITRFNPTKQRAIDEWNERVKK